MWETKQQLINIHEDSGALGNLEVVGKPMWHPEEQVMKQTLWMWQVRFKVPMWLAWNFRPTVEVYDHEEEQWLNSNREISNVWTKLQTPSHDKLFANGGQKQALELIDSPAGTQHYAYIWLKLYPGRDMRYSYRRLVYRVPQFDTEYAVDL